MHGVTLKLTLIQCFGAQYTVWLYFLMTCNALKIWFELSRVKLYRKDLKGNINYSELAGSSSYRGFELPRVKLQLICEGNPGEIDFCSSYRESTVTWRFCACSKNERHRGKLHFAFFTRKVVRLFILKGVKPSPDRKVITFLTFDNLFPPLGHSC